MTDFVKLMRDREKAEEDLYFQRLDRELIEAMHRMAETADSERKAGSPPGFQGASVKEDFPR